MPSKLPELPYRQLLRSTAIFNAIAVDWFQGNSRPGTQSGQTPLGVSSLQRSTNDYYKFNVTLELMRVSILTSRLLPILVDSHHISSALCWLKFLWVFVNSSSTLNINSQYATFVFTSFTGGTRVSYKLLLASSRQFSSLFDHGFILTWWKF
jgi:hypothetical protein